ncbi:jg24621 [Pararge aegeria aegeria]|uniref:Jg24621 protein n=1 Tax=Pararge aegeria aegeria TaxID=348720 RepID=A0A8S4R204_9NEOP|nr:jg24621 [Pararge aegeria aegeria]
MHHVNYLTGNYDVIANHLGVLQQALGVVHALKSPKGVQFDLLMSLEKQVMQSLAASRESTSVLNQLSQLIRKRRERNLSLESLLALLIHVYSLSGSEVAFNSQHEEYLQQALCVAIFEDHNTLSIEGEYIASPEVCEQKSKNVICQLKEISQMRKVLQK